MGAARKLDLREGISVWQARRAPRLPTGPLLRDMRCDALVVGAGISGALIADALSEAGLSVIILDRRGPMLGSTTASTALVQYEIDQPLSLLSRKIGVVNAERIWRRSRMAVDALRHRSRHLGIRADQVDRDSLYLSGDLLDHDGLVKEAAARRRAGFESSVLPRHEVKSRFGIGGHSALLDYGNLAVDPRKLAAGFLRAACNRGARLFSPVEVTDVDPDPHIVHAITRHGPTIRCRHLVFATGYEMPKGVPHMGNRIVSTWAIATRPQPRAIWPTACLIWEAADPYLYLRTSPDQRILCGGEDEEFEDEDKRNALMPVKREALQRKLGTLFPSVDPTAVFAWCGSFGASPTGTPTIGAVPRMPNCYAAMGYGGNGTTFSMMAAQVLRGLITGRGDPDLDLVSFTRRQQDRSRSSLTRTGRYVNA